MTRFLSNIKAFAFLVCAMIGFLPAIAQSESYSNPPRTEEQMRFFRSIPRWLPTRSSSTPLPAGVDNSLLPYFPEVFSQRSNSCSQASGVRYVYTYEYNRLHHTRAISPDSVFSYHFTWNFLNEGNDEGSHAELGYQLIQKAGVPTLSQMNDDSNSIYSSTWLNGYDEYLKAMHHRVKSYHKFSLKTREGIDLLRQYLYNHGEEGTAGGIVTFSCYSSDWTLNVYSGPSATGIHDIITRGGTNGAHALTICGYDDLVEFDLDNNGTIEDDERGAFIFVNTWGKWWGSQGKCYYPYKFFLLPYKEGGLTDSDAQALCVEPEDHEPTLVFHLNLTYSNRNDLSLMLGAADGADAKMPTVIDFYPIFNLQGGDWPMRGYMYSGDNKTIDVALDFSDFYDQVKDFKEPKFFLRIQRTAIGHSTGTGQVNHFSVNNLVTGVTYASHPENTALNRGVLMLTTDGIASKLSCNPNLWAHENGYPVPQPFIIRSAEGKQYKALFEDNGSGNIIIKYQPLDNEK